MKESSTLDERIERAAAALREADAQVRIIVEQGGKRILDRTVAPGATVEIVLP